MIETEVNYAPTNKGSCHNCKRIILKGEPRTVKADWDRTREIYCIECGINIISNEIKEENKEIEHSERKIKKLKEAKNWLKNKKLTLETKKIIDRAKTIAKLTPEETQTQKEYKNITFGKWHKENYG